jgi:hypothetical protein
MQTASQEACQFGKMAELRGFSVLAAMCSEKSRAAGWEFTPTIGELISALAA